MHNSSCPKCGQTFDGETKTCGSCGAVSRLTLLLVVSADHPYHHSSLSPLYPSTCLCHAHVQILRV
ncbi:hypothetical protein F4821DRAFT_223035 [Hypoxylon rubiginosum]|uniref:Uncharacterized protein n=1 Tax=Hypoxylon rubiginosum TaxID=110542 RepID=A0ACC0DIV8_9PEZI|nr:hypothetical protein F4821DRAFT_223035 [Hypoxylon rubiginosum]